MKLPCVCKYEQGCFHGPLIPRRHLKFAQIVENVSGKLRLVSPRDLLQNPDGSVYLRPE